MPRTRFDNRRERWDRISALFRGEIAVQRLPPESLCVAADISPSTLLRRLKRPESMTLEEYTAIGRRLNIPIEELRQRIRYQ